MTLLDTSKGDRKSLFAIYKPGQGKYVRWGTVAAMALIVGFGMAWVYQVFAVKDMAVQTIAMCVWLLAGAALTFWLINKPSLAEFMIMTESEMRKVTWPSRQTVINSTKVVIILTLVLGALLWMVDVGFIWFFEWIGILKK